MAYGKKGLPGLYVLLLLFLCPVSTVLGWAVIVHIPLLHVCLLPQDSEQLHFDV